MTYWDGTRWVPEHAPPPSRSSPIVRHVAGALTEALLIALIGMALLLAMTPSSDAARSAAGAGEAAAAGKQVYTLSFDGFRVWQDPYAFADFTVTRAKVDGTDVWVKASCVDATGAQAIPGADPLRVVTWDVTNPLVGYAALDSVMSGTSCNVWLTRSPKQSTGPAPGWPELQLEVSW
jgi:hypothetical protein